MLFSCVRLRDRPNPMEFRLCPANVRSNFGSSHFGSSHFGSRRLAQAVFEPYQAILRLLACGLCVASLLCAPPAPCAPLQRSQGKRQRASQIGQPRTDSEDYGGGASPLGAHIYCGRCGHCIWEERAPHLCRLTEGIVAVANLSYLGERAPMRCY